MRAHFYDDKPAAPGEHGPLGPTHCGSVTVDYEYQVEQWVIDIGSDHPEIVRVECPDLGRKWNRNEQGKFVEAEKTPRLVEDPPLTLHILKPQ